MHVIEMCKRQPFCIYALVFNVHPNPQFSTFKRYSSSSETITIFDIVSSFTFITIMSILIGVGVAMVGAAILFRARLGSQDLGEGMNGSLFEVLVILGTSYMAYLISDVMHLSGIFSIFFAGVIHNHYSLYNIAPDSQKIIKGLVTLLSSIAETLMFAYLGLQARGERVNHFPSIFDSFFSGCLDMAGDSFDLDLSKITPEPACTPTPPSVHRSLP